MTTKIKDGLFISDSDFSQDMDFLSSNKITYVINCAGNEVSNRFERTGIRYLTLHWNRSSSELFDNKDAIAKKIYLHVEKALCSNQCCLIHSIDGVNRAVICTTIYLMCKYGWQSSQSLQFLQILKPEIRPCQFYIRQLESFEDRVDALRATFPKTRCNYGDDEQLLLNTYNNIIKARQIMPNMTLLKYNKYSKYQEDDYGDGGSDNSNRRIQWFGPLIRPATPSYISVSEDLTLISVYRRNLHNKKLEEPLKSNIKDQIYVSPISEPKPKPKQNPTISTSSSTNESKNEPTLRKTSSTSSMSKIAMTPINTHSNNSSNTSSSIYEDTKSPLSSPTSKLAARTKNVFISDSTASNISNTNNEMKYSTTSSSKYSNLYYGNSSSSSSYNNNNSNSTTSKSPSSSSNNSSNTIRNLASRPSSSAYSCSYNNTATTSSNNNNNNLNNNNTTIITNNYRFITRPSSTTPQSTNNSNNSTPSPPIRPSSAPPKKTPPPLFIKHSVRKELISAYDPSPSPLTTPKGNDNNMLQEQQQRQPVVMYKATPVSTKNGNNNNGNNRQVHPPPPKFFNYKSPVQHATLPTNSARTMRDVIPVKEYPIAKNALQEGRRISLPPRLDDQTIRPDALTSTLHTTGTAMKLRSNTPQPKHTSIKKDKKAFHTTDTVQAWTSRTRRPTPMKKGHTSTIIRSYVK